MPDGFLFIVSYNAHRKHLTMPIVSPCRLRSKGAYDGHSNKRSISYLTNAVYIIGATQYIYIVHS